MDKKPFLDKISTSAHLPSQDGQYGLVSLSNFPDLSHTGIRCKFEKQIPYATAPDGTILPSYKAAAFKKTRMIERGLVILNSTEDVFKTGHKQFIDKVLCDMESTKLDKHKRHMKHWNTGKSKLGFGESFNSMNDSALESFTNLPVTDSEMHHDRPERKPTSPMSGDGYYDNDFEEHVEEVKEKEKEEKVIIRPISHHKSDKHIDKKPHREKSQKIQPVRKTSMVNVTFEAMSGALPGNKSERVEPLPPKRTNSNKPGVTRRSMDSTTSNHIPGQPYSTMSMFNAFLEHTPPSSPVRRYGSLAKMEPEHFTF